MHAAQFYRCLSEPLRLRILVLLSHQGPLCVCHLQDALEETQVKVSKHLAYLRRCHLVERSKQGTWAYYQLTPKAAPLLTENLKLLKTQAEDRSYFEHDLARLKRTTSDDYC